MNRLIITSSRNQPIQPLIEGALRNELRLLEAGISRTERRLREFERRFAMSSSEFVERYEQDELEETVTFAEWIGEVRMMSRLREKADALREIQFAH